MTRLRVLLIALAAMCVFALLVVTVNLINMHVHSPPDRSQPEAAQRDATQVAPSTTLSPNDGLAESGDGQREPHPEANVFGIVVDEEGNPVQGATVETSMLVPYVETPYPPFSPDTATQWNFEDFGGSDEMPDDDVSPDGASDREQADGDGGGTSATDPDKMLEQLALWLVPDCTTDAEGRFALRVPEEEWYKLTVYKPEYAVRERTFRRAARDIRIVLPPPGKVAGKVIDAATGELVPSCEVKLWGSGRRYTVAPNLLERPGPQPAIQESETGLFCFNGVAEGPCRLRVEAEGYARASVSEIFPVPGQTTHVTVALHRAAGLTGEIVWKSSGEPVVEAWVEVHTGIRSFDDPYAPSSDVYPIDQDGTFEIDAIPAVHVTVTIRRAEMGAFGVDSLEEAARVLHEQRVELSPGRTTRVLIKVADEPGRIDGVVLDGRTGEPIPGAEVALSDRLAPGLKRLERTLEHATDDGSFEFTNLRPSLYSVEVSHPEYARNYGQRILVRPGQSADDAVIELDRWTSLEGSVVDEEGNPVRAAVYCAAPGGGNASTTNEDPKFTYTRIGSGMTVVSCTVGEHMATTEQRFVDLKPGETNRVDFVFGQGVRVSGLVSVGPTPIQEGEVKLFAALGETAAAAGYRIHCGRVGADGRFSTENVRPGSYTLVVPLPWDPRSWDTSIRRDVVVDAADVDLHLGLPTGELSGRILLEDTGEPAGTADVRLVKKRDSPTSGGAALMLEGPRRTVTDPYTGTYSFDLVADGQYEVVVAKSGYGTGKIDLNIADGTPLGLTDIVLRKGCEVTGTVRTSDPLISPREATFTVRDATGEVVFEKAFHPSGPDSSLGRNGEFTLGHLCPGKYVVHVDSPGTAWTEKHITVRESANNVVDFVLPEGKTLGLEVVDQSETPVPGALADVRDSRGRSRILRSGYYDHDWYAAAYSSSDGRGITRIGHLLPGTYTLTVRAEGYTAAEQQVDVLDADETRVTVVLERLPDD